MLEACAFGKQRLARLLVQFTCPMSPSTVTTETLLRRACPRLSHDRLDDRTRRDFTQTFQVRIGHARLHVSVARDVLSVSLRTLMTHAAESFVGVVSRRRRGEATHRRRSIRWSSRTPCLDSSITKTRIWMPRQEGRGSLLAKDCCFTLLTVCCRVSRSDTAQVSE